MIAVGYLLGLGDQSRTLRDESLLAMQAEIEGQSEQLQTLQTQAERRLQALTSSVAAMKASMVRLDAMGEHLTRVAGLADGEFDFSQPPPMGGPEHHWSDVQRAGFGDVSEEIERLQTLLDDREKQLLALRGVLAGRKIEEERELSGRPIQKGWMSSSFGGRVDPFSGNRAWHSGIDFAGKTGSPILSVAAGVVTASETRPGYGTLVEISHSDGFMTRYAHNKENLVEVGELVSKGQTIALMGSSGRSTGPHVHFEVYKNGRVVDPATYVRRNRR